MSGATDDTRGEHTKRLLQQQRRSITEEAEDALYDENM